ncbi:MAG TPA: C40 family peptidase [Flavitalea sp.]|nr:C40 family peptidase [Flavitalea sp.]
MKQYLVVLASLLFLTSCEVPEDKNEEGTISNSDSLEAFGDTMTVIEPLGDTLKPTAAAEKFFSGKEIDTKNVQPGQVVEFAKTLIGIPYKYASIDPAAGFDCSGFITYVFKHFDILVPRSSIDFTMVGTEVPEASAQPGDLVLFTGTDSADKFVGHMGLVVSNENGLMSFIHSTSGKQHGVTITPMSEYYRGRYMKTIRIFPQNK